VITEMLAELQQAMADAQYKALTERQIRQQFYERMYHEFLSALVYGVRDFCKEKPEHRDVCEAWAEALRSLETQGCLTQLGGLALKAYEERTK
jgi:hypothetical protein